jgi:small redox-active disulfide protein 2
MKIQVLGSGCATCKTLYDNAREVVKKLGLNTEVEYSTDAAEIVKIGAMSSPVFAIDGEVIAAGKAPSSDEIEKSIKEKLTDKNTEKDSSCCGCSCGGCGDKC